MCRNITELRGLEPAATREEIEAAARQYIRKVTGVAKPNIKIAAALDAFALEVADVTERALAARSRPPPAAADVAAAAPARGAQADGARAVPRLTAVSRAASSQRGRDEHRDQALGVRLVLGVRRVRGDRARPTTAARSSPLELAHAARRTARDRPGSRPRRDRP